jgi:hypothetical protein
LAEKLDMVNLEARRQGGNVSRMVADIVLAPSPVAAADRQ